MKERQEVKAMQDLSLLQYRLSKHYRPKRIADEMYVLLRKFYFETVNTAAARYEPLKEILKQTRDVMARYSEHGDSK